ncbi:MAG: hypothetical protein NVSMB2_08300 [Chloroflexota bacterium]
MRHYALAHDNPALQHVAHIVRGADVFGTDSPLNPQGIGAIVNGYIGVYSDDHELVKVAVTVYEALYQWCLGR